MNHWVNEERESRQTPTAATAKDAAPLQIALEMQDLHINELEQITKVLWDTLKPLMLLLDEPEKADDATAREKRSPIVECVETHTDRLNQIHSRLEYMRRNIEI